MKVREEPEIKSVSFRCKELLTGGFVKWLMLRLFINPPEGGLDLVTNGLGAT